MKPVIVREIPRSEKDKERIAELLRYGVATISESQDKLGLLSPDIRPIQPGLKAAGTAITVRCADGDNLMLHAALEVARPGDVIVLTTISGGSRNGMFGELLANAFITRGVSALITDSGVRDVARLREMKYPVWSRYITAVGTSKNTPGWVNVPIVIGGVNVDPGDFILADDDGVVVVRREEIDAVLENASKRESKEEVTRKRILNGELTVDIYGFKKVLADLGVNYVDRL
ncbi:MULTISPECIES: 4-carboxy-4-hydroxy-2-oxoadipate aldolase/oxaloacetate decarboxylase [Metallosphaera]|uniref:4-carboxy-4-hydroxy-2-oxoadipate aldolase/oxaloacetate decarboxylase n=1 Tax=Metallosphaera TaxID=41980 RepID=UPI001F0691B9|nr:4-carboxy-4-hydroxy-2-oxoadipate aldolase/oxaloacetate decarboxylase [Metallosphaera sedula]MCH1771578.1 4-carboxy-4-hydroxy-2-oxoadipate aldolase/oxaloacetate decarboxylase [Metallosphaera sedula]MCP6728649.1 4-carboxy-4-hydroxy-2-oxoadipate aldolase/oxaloacetate decarboxylase [Metallosphaera sedula]